MIPPEDCERQLDYGYGKKILRAAAEVLERGGPAALTTRAICEAAGVKSPTLYHHFGDENGLAAALVRRGIAEFVARKRAVADIDDPMKQLRAGWDQGVDFALKRPALHALSWSSCERSLPRLVGSRMPASSMSPCSLVAAL